MESPPQNSFDCRRPSAPQHLKHQGVAKIPADSLNTSHSCEIGRIATTDPLIEGVSRKKFFDNEACAPRLPDRAFANGWEVLEYTLLSHHPVMQSLRIQLKCHYMDSVSKKLDLARVTLAAMLLVALGIEHGVARSVVRFSRDTVNLPLVTREAFQ